MAKKNVWAIPKQPALGASPEYLETGDTVTIGLAQSDTKHAFLGGFDTVTVDVSTDAGLIAVLDGGADADILRLHITTPDGPGPAIRVNLGGFISQENAKSDVGPVKIWMPNFEGFSYIGTGSFTFNLDANPEPVTESVTRHHAFNILGTNGNNGIFLEDAGESRVKGLGGDDAILSNGAAAAYLYGGDGDDELTALGAGSVASGERGDDVVSGAGAGTVLNGGKGNDRLISGDEIARMIGGSGGDLFIVNGTVTKVDGGGGDDSINMTVSVENTLVKGGKGIDQVTFSSVDTTPLYVEVGRNGVVKVQEPASEITKIVGAGGDKTYFTAKSVEKFVFSSSNLPGDQSEMFIDATHRDAKAINITTSFGGDILLGSKFNDVMDGGGGADYFEGGRGADEMHAGIDLFRDTFAFKRGDLAKSVGKSDKIFQFNEEHDKIALYDFDGDSKTRGFQRLDFATQATANAVWVENQGSQTLIFIDFTGDAKADNVIWLDGGHDLTESNLVLTNPDTL